jgi:hypothetical protein
MSFVEKIKCSVIKVRLIFVVIQNVLVRRIMIKKGNILDFFKLAIVLKENLNIDLPVLILQLVLIVKECSCTVNQMNTSMSYFGKSNFTFTMCTFLG